MALPLLPIIGAGVAGLGGIIGELLGGANRAEAERILNEARDEFGRLDIPRLRELAAEQLGPSAMEGVTEDVDYQAAMRGALGRMRELDESQGMTAVDRASMAEGLDAANRSARANRAMVSRRFGQGSGAGLATALQGSSDAAERANTVGMDSAAEAQRRYWQNVQNRFQAGRAATTDDYNRKADRAHASDAVNRWNASSRMDTARGNNAVRQANYDNAYRKAAGQADLAQAQAAQKTGQADRIGNIGAGVGNAVNMGLNAYDAWDRRDKK